MGCAQATAATMPSAAVEVVTFPADASRDQQDWALRDEVLRVFDLADKDQHGRLDMKVFSKVVNKYVTAYVHDVQEFDADTYLSDCVGRHEWLAYFYRLSEANDKIAIAALKAYEKHILEVQNVERNFAVHKVSVPADWPWRDEVGRVFALADKDQNGQLDVEELTYVRNSREGAEAMMLKVDTDFSGTVSLDEWVNYFYRLFVKNDKAAASLLKLYEKQIGEHKIIQFVRASTTEIVDRQTTGGKGN